MKRIASLLAITALASGTVLAASAGYAQEPNGYSETESDLYVNKNVDEDITISWDNDVDVDVKKSLTVTKDVNITGSIDITGEIDINNSAMATIDNKQMSVWNSATIDDETNDATLAPNTFNWSGNSQANVAAGTGNVQDNAAAIASTSGPYPYDPPAGGHAEAEAFVLQQSLGNTYTNYDDYDYTYGQSTNTAKMDGTFKGSGNNQGNVAAGAFNVQKNALSIATAEYAVLSEATAAAFQESGHNSTTGNFNNDATMKDAFEGAGNNQGNVAAGVGNMQANTLVIATSNGS